MPRLQYVCPDCGNTLPTGVVEKQARGPRGPIRYLPMVFCESSAHKEPVQMERQEYTPEPRVRKD